MSIAFCLSLSPSLSFLSSLVLADRLSTTICEHYDFQTWFLRFAAIERRCTRCVWVLCSNLWVFIQCALPEIEYKRRNRKKNARTHIQRQLLDTNTHIVSALLFHFSSWLIRIRCLSVCAMCVLHSALCLASLWHSFLVLSTPDTLWAVHVKSFSLLPYLDLDSRWC